MLSSGGQAPSPVQSPASERRVPRRHALDRRGVCPPLESHGHECRFSAPPAHPGPSLSLGMTSRRSALESALTVWARHSCLAFSSTARGQTRMSGLHTSYFFFASLTMFSTSRSNCFASYRIPSFITYLTPPTRSTAPVVSFTRIHPVPYSTFRFAIGF